MNLKNFPEEKNLDTKDYISTGLHLHEAQEKAKLIYYDKIYYNEYNGCI